MTGFDTELDALFKSSAGASHVVLRPTPTPIPQPAVAPTNQPRKRKHEKSVSFTEQTKSKKFRKHELGGKRITEVTKKADDSSDEDEEPTVKDSDRKLRIPLPTAQRQPKKGESSLESGSESDSPPVHESLLPQNKRPSHKHKYVPEGETPEQRDARTIYIGNLPASAANNSARKALHKHILHHLTSAHPDLPKPKIESSRFRSIAFKNPTSKLPSDALSTSKSSKPTTNDHHRQRAAEWRSAQDPEDGKPHKVFQTPAQKKKTAFITGALHDSASSSASAYVVFAHPLPVEGQEPPWNPFEVAARAVTACNGTGFMDRTLRVDYVQAKGAANPTERAVEVGEKADPRTMIFVGNLDFEVHEDAVRELFEKLVEKERGTSADAASRDNEEGEEDEDESQEDGDDSEEASEGGHSEDESDEDLTSSDPPTSAQPKSPAPTTTRSGHHWVKSVRIIRDKDTQLGKGFAYVQFYDRASADEILAMEQGTIKLAKRKLRIQRCKTLPGVTLPKPKSKERPRPAPASRPSRTDKPASIPRRSSVSIIPRADPGLGDRIRSLPKAERKAVKSSEADRVARRLAKKKARVAADRGVRKAAGRKEGILGGRSGGKGKAVKSGKGKRERSDKAMLKKNTKK